MTDLTKYLNTYIEVKYFLSCYRAPWDGQRGIKQLEDKLNQSTFYLLDWNIIWIWTCATLRTAIDLFQIDAKSCISSKIRSEIAEEWKKISKNRSQHQIFWEFLRRERDNIVHEYEWLAYEAWLKPDGTIRPAHNSLLIVNDDGARPVLLMQSGPFAGRNSIELLRESAEWVETRIVASIRRAGFDPEEKRNLATFSGQPAQSASIKSLLSGDDTETT
jgi:hypothetical protein